MMASSPSELSLDCKPHSYSMLLKSVGEQNISTDHHHTQKLEDFLSRLEEERLKIDAFKRELPLCMQLLSNAMDAYKQQLQSYKANQGPKPVLEEFIPLKHGSSELGSDKAASIADKANWMTSAQLWSTNQPSEGIMSQESLVHQQPKQRMINNGGAFHPFTKALPDLALANSVADKDMELDQKNVNGGSLVKDQTDSQTNNNSNSSSQTHRKARRCWSPDLHRRFVNALQMLGGSQVATPKQIRELMKVDGLTNDEVKSHLQKYRLHTRRPSPSPQQAAAAAGQPQLVVLGSIWVPPEYATAAHGGAPVYQTAHGPAHYSQEFYPAAAAQAHQVAHGHHHHHAFHNQLHIYNAPLPPPTQQSSPESDVRGTGDRSESIEDGKSESGSWKADSNGGGGERKAVVVREELGEESNASEITLKF